MTMAPRPPLGDVVIAVDVGGTLLKCALVGADGTVHHQIRRPTEASRGPEAVVDAILRTVVDLAGQARTLGATPRAAGLVVPGVIDPVRGVAVYAANLGWRDVPLRELTEARLGLPVALGHDVRAGGLAEARLGGGRGSEQMLFVAIGTGIAGAHVVNGAGNDGAHGAACEIGHLVVRPGGVRCACGQRGCVETIGSAAALARRYAEATGTSLGAAEVAHAAFELGDPVAQRLWQETVDALADGLLAAMTLLDPDTIVVGGGLSEAGDGLLKPLEAALRDKAAPFHTVPRIVRAELGDEAGCIGAGLLGLGVVA